MQYMGGKSRIARSIANIINEVPRWQEPNSNTIGKDPHLCGGAHFVSLFCGSCSVESKVTGFDSITLNDKHEYLIALLKGVQQGYELPETITEDQYQYIYELTRMQIPYSQVLWALGAALEANGLAAMPVTVRAPITPYRVKNHC